MFYVSIPHRYDKNEMILMKGMFFGYVFQSLIGTIKTDIIITERLIQEKVSIPHRYDKNERITTKRPAVFGVVSIPHRYDKN